MPQKKKRAGRKKALKIQTRHSGATRQRTLRVLRHFLIGPSYVDAVARAEGLSSRSVSRIVSDAQSVGFVKRSCPEFGCAAFSLSIPGSL